MDAKEIFELDLNKIGFDQRISAADGKSRAQQVYVWLAGKVTYDDDLAIKKMHVEASGPNADPRLSREVRSIQRTAQQVIEGGKGVCIELAVAYVALANMCGLDAHVAQVRESCFGEKFHQKGAPWGHVCAAVTFQETIAVDLDQAYNKQGITINEKPSGFQVPHRKLERMPLERLLFVYDSAEMFAQMYEESD
ncbi:transglutaminase domain-containing protein [Candidatus Woesearchaeota archaeon]|nr:transglutaminase domain-containing protein [Candidatus Woesearchaeota archaeon]